MVDQAGGGFPAGSRESRAGAGWECEAGSAHSGGGSGSFSWLDPKPLWQSRNDRLSRWLGDPTGERRAAWMSSLGHTGDSSLTVDRSRADDTTAFLVLGDTGEGDSSQGAVVPSLLARADGTDFMFICSDVIYPAGGVEEYGPKLFEPYAAYEKPIFAIPGNHDWYDDCTGFMRWFCGAVEPPTAPAVRRSLKGLLRRALWPRAPRPRADLVTELAAAARPPVQPAPYFAIDAGPLLLVGIDTGIGGELDHAQGLWLKQVSKGPKPKILLTGKPIYVDGKYRPGRIEGTKTTVDDLVVDPDHNYIAAIGGDIHNYQRYPVRLADGRTILYLVSGGGGAFMHATHTLPNIDRTAIADRVSEASFRCYPLRGDSLSLYSKLYAEKWLGRMRGAAPIPADEAAAIVGARLGIEPTRASAAKVTPSSGSIRSADALMGLPGRGRGALHLPFSEWLDWNKPPLFKSFLRVDAESNGARIRCFAATGCAQQEGDPPLEDDLRWAAGEGGGWELPA